MRSPWVASPLLPPLHLVTPSDSDWAALRATPQIPRYKPAPDPISADAKLLALNKPEELELIGKDMRQVSARRAPHRRAQRSAPPSSM